MGFGSILNRNSLFLFHMVYLCVYLLLLLFHVFSSVKIERVEVFDVAKLVFALESVVVEPTSFPSLCSVVCSVQIID